MLVGKGEQNEALQEQEPAEVVLVYDERLRLAHGEHTPRPVDLSLHRGEAIASA